MSDNKQAVDKQALTKRPRYFDGQYLNVDDFTSEQQYHIDRQRRLGRFLHVSGVLEGLVATVEGTGIKISPGTAIDSQGQQILLLEPILLPETDINSALSASPVKDRLVLTYTEENTNEQVSGNADSATRCHEKAAVGWITEEESKAAGVQLAKVSKNASGLVVDRTVCQYSGVYLPSDGAGAGPVLRSGGTTTPNRAELTGSLLVFGSLTVNNTVALKGSSTTTGLTVNASGNVGIGTTTPKIHLAIGDDDTGLNQEGDGQIAIYANNQERMRIGDGLSFRNWMVLRDGTITSSGTTVTGSNTSFTTQLQVGDWIVASGQTKRITAIASNNSLTIDSAFSPALATATIFHSQSLLFRIQNNGNIGIGTTTPLAKLAINGGLHIGGDSDPGNDNLLVDGRIKVDSGVIQRGGNAIITDTQDLGLYSQVSGHWLRLVTHNAPIHFFTDKGSNGTGGTSRMVLSATGNLGIGFTDASAKLSVNGGLHVGGTSDPGDSNLEVDGSVGIGTSAPQGRLDVQGRILRCGQDFSVTGEATHGTFITPPWGNRNDWNIFVSPRDVGFDEPGSNQDNAMIHLFCFAQQHQTNVASWRVVAQYVYRVGNNSDQVKTGYGTANYILIPK